MPKSKKGKMGASRAKRGGAFPKQMSYPQLANLPVGAVSVIGGRKMMHLGGGKFTGGSFLGDVWNGVKSVANTAVDVGKAIASPVNDILKSTKAISRFGSMIPVVGNTVSGVAGMLGYGKRGGKKYRAIKG